MLVSVSWNTFVNPSVRLSILFNLSPPPCILFQKDLILAYSLKKVFFFRQVFFKDLPYEEVDEDIVTEENEDLDENTMAGNYNHQHHQEKPEDEQAINDGLGHNPIPILNTFALVFTTN